MKKPLIFAVFVGYFWLAILIIHSPLPTRKKPLVFYSNQLRADLKNTYLHALKKAKKSIVMQMYGLTDPDLIALLLKKQSQGVDIQIYYDQKGSVNLPTPLSAYPIKSAGLMHRKIIVIDDATVLLGTANCTTQSLKMHDNLVMGIYHPELALFFKNSSKEKGNFIVKDIPLSVFLLPDIRNEAFITLCQKIDAAKESIQIAMFTLTHPLLLEKIIAAKKRNVSISVAIDHYTALGASKKTIQALKNEGIEILKSLGNQLLHHKWAIIDKKTFILGSANWTSAAFEKNQDCLLILDNLPSHDQKKLERIWKAVAIGTEKG